METQIEPMEPGSTLRQRLLLREIRHVSEPEHSFAVPAQRNWGAWVIALLCVGYLLSQFVRLWLGK